MVYQGQMVIISLSGQFLSQLCFSPLLLKCNPVRELLLILDWNHSQLFDLAGVWEIVKNWLLVKVYRL